MTPIAAIEALCAIHSAEHFTTDDGRGLQISVDICHGCGEAFPCTSRRILEEVTPA